MFAPRGLPLSAIAHVPQPSREEAEYKAPEGDNHQDLESLLAANTDEHLSEATDLEEKHG